MIAGDRYSREKHHSRRMGIAMSIEDDNTDKSISC